MHVHLYALTTSDWWLLVAWVVLAAAILAWRGRAVQLLLFAAWFFVTVQLIAAA